MTKIKMYVEDINGELCGAKKYAEKYVEYKAEGNAATAQKYKEMANDELKHAMLLHDFAAADIKKLKDAGLQPSQKMANAWEESHVDYVEKAAMIKQMLAL